MNDYTQSIMNLPGASFLQTSLWAEIKAPMGWQSRCLTFPKEESSELEAALQILIKPLPLGLCFYYVPRGPLMDWSNKALREKVLSALIADAKAHHAVFIKIDPDVPVTFGEPGSESEREDPAGVSLIKYYRENGWVHSSQQIQFANSVWIDVTPDEETMLSRMKQRTRYKVRLAEKKGVSVRQGTPEDFQMLTEMYRETAARDAFLIRPADYYLKVWKLFYSEGILTPLIAEVKGEACAAVMIFTLGDTARYVYGMSRNLHREKMPNYLLQWEAMRLAKARGCRVYDLWGAPDKFSENDRMWGVYQFKRGLGGEVVLTPGAWDLPLMKLPYQMFVRILPKLSAFLKRRNHNAAA